MTLPPFIRFYPPEGGAPFDPTLTEWLEESYPGVKERNGAIQAPTNAAWLVEKVLVSHGVNYKQWLPKTEVKRLPTSLIEVKGLRAVDPKTGIAMMDFVTPYQIREPFKYAANSGVVFNWPPGSGKSLGAMIWSLLVPGLTVVVTGAKGRLQWQAQLRRYTELESAILVGQGHVAEVEIQIGERLTKTPMKGLRDYVAEQQIWCSCNGIHAFELVQRVATAYVRKGKIPATFNLFARVCLPAGHHELGGARTPFDIAEPELPANVRFLIVGWETLPWHVDKLIALKPVNVILDESHTAKNHRQIKIVPVSEADLTREPKAKMLDDGRWVKYVNLENVADSTAKLCKVAKRRALTTATLLKDRVRDLWAQLHYAEPWQWGAYWPWAKRYCNAVKNQWGGMDDKGSSNLDELYARMSFIRSFVSVEESHSSMPAKRREIIYLAPDAQQAADEGFAEELAAARIAKAKFKDIANIRLAEACSRKRKAIIDAAVEAVNGGSNVIVFTARKADVEVFRKLIKQPGEKGSRLVKNAWAFFGSGDDSFEARHEAATQFMQIKESALFVGTGGAFGEQIDLHNADLFIGAMLPITPGEVDQWEGRAYRLGGRSCLYNYYVAEGTYDEHVASLLLDKLPAAEKMGSQGVVGLRAAFMGNEQELLEQLAAQIMAGDQSEIVGIANDD